MIRNDKQLEITKGWLKKFQETIEEKKSAILVVGEDELLRQIQIDGLQSKVDDFEREIAEYLSRPPGYIFPDDED